MDEELKRLKQSIIDSGYEDVIVFENPSYASAFVGISEDNRAVYNYDMMVEYLVRVDGMEEIDAVDFIDYNTLRSLPYQENAPIIFNELLEY